MDRVPIDQSTRSAEEQRVAVPDRILQIPADWNDTAAEYPDRVGMHALFETAAHRSPDSVALVHGETCLTYGELNSSANRLARHLQHLGVGPNVLVGICTHRCAEMIIALLAVLKAGGAYVPLDPTYPPERLAGMMGDVALKVLLTTSDLRGRVPAYPGHLACVDDLASECAMLPSDDLGPTAAPDDLCYVIFTSGSTGKPKAAAVHHQGWVNLVTWFVREFSVDITDRILVISSFSFDITQRSIAMPLIAGGELHLFAPNLYDPEKILDTISRRKVTRINCAPSTFYPLVENPSKVDHEY
jgi:non-ribosomal peptide synthetase component F